MNSVSTAALFGDRLEASFPLNAVYIRPMTHAERVKFADNTPHQKVNYVICFGTMGEPLIVTEFREEAVAIAESNYVLYSVH
ncbi:hypothetical protein N8083_00955 [Candidatus Pacebacteria bacterium]|nr:hypothetical protein [Candidatus Paceibacterota bacterium]